MSVTERLSRLTNKIYDRMRDRAAFDLRAEDAVGDSFEPLRGRKYAVLVTFRRNGDAVPSPIWFGLDDEGRAFVHTGVDSLKVKRLGNDPRVLLAPSNARGKPTGPPISGVARVLPKGEWPHAEATLAAAYGMSRKLYEGALGVPEDKATYLEINPG
jgi:PPOX class probable F420-dependent enzyme